ncbi:AraC-like DNA-binding protein [Trinickia symbiotica]|uniref:AraC family transcriptional regulator n=2 Tax=Trinickia symbiotica TaxID=863227 RepID=A0A2N7WVD6_9BURK|nr:helix-turn-helix domain-containing protein [Trinickia symbiotica]PMS33438.1 AraC family transcriptional regulator [Trinickia symbiotica]PPK42398.1 AraC-like DNA-binding protein [Trinickia symbiotica]
MLTNGIVHSHFDVQREPVLRQLLAWRERVGHVVDIVPSREQIGRPFRGAIDRYDVGDIVFTDCYTDELLLERTIARISRDSVRSFVFQVFLSGGVEPLAVHSATRRGAFCGGILALDMDQPIRMLRHAGCVVALFAPVALLQEVFADPAAIHGRVLGREQPMVQFIIDHISALAEKMRHMTVDQARRSLVDVVLLLASAFGREAGLAGDARAAARAAMFDRVRRYVRANLVNPELSPEHVLDALGLARATLYRLFQHEGGLGAYIRHLRLRQAADELVRYPDLRVKDIAYGLGFKSGPDFTRAFRRAYGMAPQDVRAMDIRATPDWDSGV